ncbi:MAG: excinuclease subunit, partial [Arthrobacter pascens]|nr:excinuclease subunit [Arthrobacter pascens]
MADPASYRPQTGEIPTNPGVYRFRDPHGRVIYVGKAKNLRSRLNSYFANPAGLLPKTHAMVHAASSVEWTVVGSELESLQLEYTWIKEFKPRFNVVFRDDKTYPYLAVTMGEKLPRVQVMRGERRKGTRYFGPYTAGAIRETMDTLLRVFPVRSCSAGVLKRAQASGRPCLLGYIDKCSAPCVGRVTPEEHRALAEDFCAFMGGEAKRFIARLEKDMAAAVAELDYERAARIRDDIAALRKVFERNAVVLAEDTDADVFALHEDELEAAVQVFHQVRGGGVLHFFDHPPALAFDTAATDMENLDRRFEFVLVQREHVGVRVLGQHHGVPLEDLAEGRDVVADPGGPFVVQFRHGRRHVLFQPADEPLGLAAHEGAEVLGQRPVFLGGDAPDARGRALVDVAQQ